jgi:putative membrane protein
MNTGKHLVLASLIGAFSVGMAQAQRHGDDAPGAVGPPDRDPIAQPAPQAPETSSSSAASPKYEAILGDSSGVAPAIFVKMAALGGMTEVALGKIAQTMARDPNVRKFADEMIKDHSKANTELATLAKAKGLAVPSTLDSEHNAIVQKLGAKTGADFDSAYSKQMMEDHDETIALFEGATKSSDKDVAAFAQRTLPTLERHKQMADSLPTS